MWAFLKKFKFGLTVSQNVFFEALARVFLKNFVHKIFEIQKSAYMLLCALTRATIIYKHFGAPKWPDTKRSPLNAFWPTLPNA